MMNSEIQTYIELLRARRAEMLHTIEGLNADALNWQPLPTDTNSLFALATHSLGAERRMVHEFVGGRKIDRDRAAELRVHGDDIEPLRMLYAVVARQSEEILNALGEAELDGLCGVAPNTHTARWCILHALEHYNEHLGQMRLTRQWWESHRA